MSELGSEQEIDEELMNTLERVVGRPFPSARPIVQELMASAREGHLCLPLEELKKRLSKDRGENSEIQIEEDDEALFPPKIFDHLVSATKRATKPLVIAHRAIYLQKNWIREASIQTHLLRLLSLEDSMGGEPIESDSSLNEEQNCAYRQALSQRLTLITGGPGCGKSYVAKKIIRRVLGKEVEKKKVVVCAPTGKAVYNLKRALSDLMEHNIVFSTLHSLLKIGFSNAGRKRQDIIEADMVIVDECSMIDVRLFEALFSSIHVNTQLVLIGDPNQLPPVESGTVFTDLCRILSQHRCHLKECHRIETTSLLRIARAAIELPAIEAKRVIVSEKNPAYLFSSLETFDHEVISRVHAHIYAIDHGENWPAWEDAFNSHKILCSHNLGRYGAHTLNEKLKEMTHQQEPSQFHVLPVILTKNLPKQGLMNGSQGLLVRRKGPDRESLIFQVEGEYREFSPALIPHFSLGFALSIHKSQGSEYREVSLLLSNEFALFGRESIYTGITRCREKLSIYCEEESLDIILNQTSLKFSGLRSV